MSEIAVFDQEAVAEGVEGQTPLYHCADVIPESAAFSLKEKPFLCYLTLRGKADDTDFNLGVEKALGIELPVAPLSLIQDEAHTLSIQWVSPDEWMIVAPAGEAFDIEQRLRKTLSGHFAVVNVSGGLTLLELSGEQALNVLHKSTVYDVHPRNFPVGKAVTTTLAKATMVLRRPDEDRWELIIRRSFADYCWRWLVAAGEEFF